MKLNQMRMRQIQKKGMRGKKMEIQNKMKTKKMQMIMEVKKEKMVMTMVNKKELLEQIKMKK